MEEPKPIPAWLAMPSFRFDHDEGAWKSLSFNPEAPLPQSPARPLLRVATFNVLFDKYDGDKICTAERVPHIFSLLAGCNADLICLQEVTGPWLRGLLKQDFVRDSFWVSDGPESVTLLEYGQVLLCRLPFRCATLQFSRYKMAVLAELRFGAAVLGVAGIHLPSNYFDGGDDGAAGVSHTYQLRRQAHLAAVVQRLERCDLQLLLGDFNYDPERDGCPDPAGFEDADAALQRVTFDALCNPTAAVTSRSAKQRRYDRILFRGNGMRALECGLLGTEACVAVAATGARLCPSDHYGVAARLTMPCAVLQFAGGVSELLRAQQSRIGSPAGETARREAAAGWLRGMLPEAWQLAAVGSAALGCVVRDSDLDLALSGAPLSEARRLLRGRTALEPAAAEDGEATLRVHAPDGLVIEVQSGEGEGGEEARGDVAALRAAWGDRREQYVEAIVFVKLWATRLGLYGTVWGFPNGLAYAVLVTAAARGLPASQVTADALVQRFFAVFAEHDWRQPVLLGPGRYEGRPHDWLPVGAPASGRSICRCATRSSLRVFREALREANGLYPDLARLLLQQRRDGLPLFFSAHPHYLCVNMPEPRLALSRLPALVIFLEKCGLECVPYSSPMAHGEAACQLLGLSGPPPDCFGMIPGTRIVSVAGPLPAEYTKKRFRFVAVLEAPPEAAAAAAAAPADDNVEEPIDFAARVAGLSSEKIFAAVKWDPAWRGGLTEIVWEDRFLGFLRKPVAQFHPSAIPWHRVRAFYHDDKLIWWRGDPADFDVKKKK